MGGSRQDKSGLNVLIIPLGRKAGTVTARLRGGSYRVALNGGVQLTVKESDLEFVAVDGSTKPKELAETRLGPKNTEIIRSSKLKPRAEVDLHGMRVDDARGKLEEWLNQMILARMWHGKVIHGLGTGKLQIVTHEVLSRYPAVSSFKINQFNRGETDVYFC